MSKLQEEQSLNEVIEFETVEKTVVLPKNELLYENDNFAVDTVLSGESLSYVNYIIKNKTNGFVQVSFCDVAVNGIMT